jgi:hypothetical protein
VAAGRAVTASRPVAATAIRLRRGNPEGQHHQSNKAQHSFRDRFHDNSPDRSFYFKPFVLTTPTLLGSSENTQMGLSLDQENLDAKKQSRRIGESVFDTERREPIQNRNFRRDRFKSHGHCIDRGVRSGAFFETKIWTGLNRGSWAGRGLLWFRFVATRLA